MLTHNGSRENQILLQCWHTGFQCYTHPLWSCSRVMRASMGYVTVSAMHAAEDAQKKRTNGVWVERMYVSQ